MRLIDADSLKNLPWIIDRGMHDCGEEFVYMSAIDRSPTIEAIPIEWIKAWTSKSENTYYRDQVLSMMEDWRKEHETD